jgi:uncharacterized protein (DUF302 family)
MNNLEGIKILKSPFSVEETIDRLVSLLKQHGATIYARINQQAELATIGQQIPPMQILMFGNPSAGGPLMALKPISALDLPLKILAWQNDQKKCLIAFNEVSYIKDRYELPGVLTAPLDLQPLISKALAKEIIPDK